VQASVYGFGVNRRPAQRLLLCRGAGTAHAICAREDEPHDYECTQFFAPSWNCAPRVLALRIRQFAEQILRPLVCGALIRPLLARSTPGDKYGTPQHV